MDAESFWILGKGMTIGVVGAQSHHPSSASLEGMGMKNDRCDCDQDCALRLCNRQEQSLQEFRYFMQISCRRDYPVAW